MKKIIFGITSLNPGGAERVLVDVVNELQQFYDITVFTIYSNGEFAKEISENIKIKSIYNKKYDELTKFEKIVASFKMLFSRKKIYTQYIKGQYDVEIAFLEGPITRIFSIENKQAKKIAWIHNDITKVFGNDFKSKIKSKIDEKIYMKFNELVFVSKDNLEKFVEKYSNVDNNKQLIYNYINKEKIIKKSEEKFENPFKEGNVNILTIARLVEQKAIGRLIDVHSKLIENGVLHNIYVIGDGPEKEKLQNKIKELEVENTFILLGQKQNPYPYLKNADAFALMSYYEGYGMVLEEAKILQKDIIITDTAAREVLEGTNNLIVENSEEGIYEGIKSIVENEKKIEHNDFNKNEGNLDKIKKIIND